MDEVTLRIKRLSKIVIGIISILIVVFLFFNSFYTIKEQQQGIVLTFGKPTDVKSAGLNFKIPFIQSVKKIDTTIRGFAIGYDEENQYNQDAIMITNDYNFVNVDFFVEWRVTDPIKALYNSINPVEILSKTTQSTARNIIGNTSVDNILTTGKTEIQSKIKDEVSKTLDTLDLGIQVHNITIQDAEPPTQEIMDAFKAVESAKQDKDRYIHDANKYKNEQIPYARGNADKILKESEAQKESRINESNGQVARFNEMFEEYEKNKTITKKRLFFETMEEVVPNLEVIIESKNGETQKFYPVKEFAGGND